MRLRSQIIQHWKAKDDPEHLCTIRDHLLFYEHQAGRLLGLNQQWSRGEEFSPLLVLSVLTDDSQEQTELLLAGLVEKHNGYIKIKNSIYRNVFNAEWAIKHLDNLRPYSQTFTLKCSNK